MSDTMSDNLQGDLAGLNSAWEGLMLSLGGGQSIFRTIIQWLTKMVSTINDNCKAIADWATDLYNNSIIIRGIL
jgi:TP901 family phage tail tape measure protein